MAFWDDARNQRLSERSDDCLRRTGYTAGELAWMAAGVYPEGHPLSRFNPPVMDGKSAGEPCPK